MTRTIVRLATVDSTQSEAFRLAAAGAADGTVVVADTQRSGRGRRGRGWHDVPGASVLVSLLVRPRLAAAALPQLSFVAAVAVAEALEATTGLTPRLKWPNDVLARGRKVAGILLESRPGDAAGPCVVIGIGVNLAQRAFPEALADRATSVLLETGRAPGRDTVLEALLEAFDRWRARLEGDGFGAVRDAWRARTETLGRRVSVEGVAGTAVDIDEAGALLVDDGGRVRRIVSGELEAGEVRTGETDAAGA
ncbi:MAG: biotin--[acetyl-CoA-carboxylase] ligase [Candidatus Rokuibacteriota bacterium]